MIVVLWAYCLTLKIETVHSLEISGFCQTTRHHIAEGLKNTFLTEVQTKKKQMKV
jgi:hypothetical protein